MSQLKKNLGMQTLYQIVATITPLITSPHLSRKLGVEALGNYSFSYSIVNYFLLFSMLGFVNYGTRAIASSTDEENRTKIFSEIYLLQLFSCFFSLFAYTILIFFLHNNYLLLQGIWVLSCFFDITWFYFGREDFKKVVIRNLILKLLTVICILLLVNDSNDLYKYILIMAGGTFISQISLWILSIKKIQFKYIKIKEVLKHVKPVLILFIPILTMSVYHVMDKTMLGLLSNKVQSGYYYNADKIINIPLCVLAGISTVMLPNITSTLSRGLVDEAKNKIRKTLKYIIVFSIAMSFGIYGISKDFVPLFFGKGYNECIILIKVLSFVLIIKSISDVLRTQYMIPFKKEKIFIKTVIFGSLINLISNYILIKIFNRGALGATIATLIAEFVVCIVQIILLRNDFNVKEEIKVLCKFLFLGVIMLFIINLVSFVKTNIILKIILEIILGGSFYVIILLIFSCISKDELYLNFLGYLTKLKATVNINRKKC